MKFDETRKLQARSHAVIPGGAHTYAKGDDQYPELAPGFIARGRGCHAWDVDGNEFIEYNMGLRSVTLGHAYPEVIKAAEEAMRNGTNFTRPSPLEVECAEELLGIIDGADMVKFTKDGSTATTAASPNCATSCCQSRHICCRLRGALRNAAGKDGIAWIYQRRTR